MATARSRQGLRAKLFLIRNLRNRQRDGQYREGSLPLAKEFRGEDDMALVIEGEERIAAPVQKVWESLNDPAVLKDCIPGCKSLNKKSDTELEATVVLKIGPIKATFAGEVALKNLQPPHSYTIVGEGKGGIAGFAKGGADVQLSEDGADTTVLKYAAKAEVGGKIAQLGSRLIASTSKKLAGEFFSSFNKRVSSE
jgi:carbon monoxide dehydrogenase subunit G